MILVVFQLAGWCLLYLPGGCALPDIAHHALERLGAVPERAHAAVPVRLVGRGLRLPFRPFEKTQTQKPRV